MTQLNTKCSFWIKVFIIKGGKKTGWAILSTNNCNQVFGTTGNESFTLLWMNFGSLISAELLKFSHIGGQTLFHTIVEYS